MRSTFDPYLESSTAGSKGGLAPDLNERLLKLKKLDHIWTFWNV